MVKNEILIAITKHFYTKLKAHGFISIYTDNHVVFRFDSWYVCEWVKPTVEKCFCQFTFSIDKNFVKINTWCTGRLERGRSNVDVVSVDVHDIELLSKLDYAIESRLMDLPVKKSRQTARAECSSLLSKMRTGSLQLSPVSTRTTANIIVG